MRGVLVSLGARTFSHRMALALAAALVDKLGMSATLKQVMVGEREDEPTEWYYVMVRRSFRESAEVFLLGWMAFVEVSDNGGI